MILQDSFFLTARDKYATMIRNDARNQPGKSTARRIIRRCRADLLTCSQRILKQKQCEPMQKKRFFPFLAFTCSVIAVAVFSLADLAAMTPSGVNTKDYQTDFDTGRELFENRRYAEAFARFSSLFDRYPEDPDVSFMMGRSAFEAGDVENAAMIFDRLLIMEPDAMRARLELGRCFMNLGAYATAKYHFSAVLAADPPENVKSNIRAFIRAADEALEQHFFTGFLKPFAGWNDNPGTLPGIGAIAIPALDNLVVSIDPTDADTFIGNHLTVTHRYRPESGRLIWETAVSNYNMFYTDTGSETINYYSVETGPSFTWHALVISPRIRKTYLERHYAKYMDSTGISLSSVFPVRPGLRLQTELAAEKKQFSDSLKDADAFSAQVQGVITTPRTRWYAGVLAGCEDAGADVYDLTRFELAAGTRHALADDLFLNLNARVAHLEYDGVYTLFNTGRTDTGLSLGVGIEKTLWKKIRRLNRIACSLDYMWTENHSTIGLYDYTQNQVMVSIIFEF